MTFFEKAKFYGAKATSGIILVSLFSVIGGGCWEEKKIPSHDLSERAEKDKLASPIITDKLHSLPQPMVTDPEPTEDEDPPQWIHESTQDQPEVEFSSEREVLLAFHAKKARFQREKSLEERKTISMRSEQSSPVSFPHDPDYKTHLPSVGADVSSLPVLSTRVLTADRYIPIVLENGINSQLGGRFIGIVDEHVFSNQGRNIILPKGSRLICSYESLTGEGSRLNASCSRVIRPDGASLLLTEAYVADQMGRKGIPGKVDHRLWDKYGAAFMLASLSSLAAAGTRNGLPEGLSQSTGLFGMQTAQMTAQTLKETINIAPVMTVASGSRLLIIPMNDIWIREVKQNISANKGDK